MKSRILGAIFLGVGAILALGGFALAEGENSTQSSEEKILTVVEQCSSIKKHFAKIHSTDALKRVNLGQFYELISNNLMAKMNARIILNRFNGADLVKISSDFDQNIEYFRDNYTKYETELKRLEKQNCSNATDAREFYAQLEKVRSSRREVEFNVSKLSELAKEYQKSVSDFKKALK